MWCTVGNYKPIVDFEVPTICIIAEKAIVHEWAHLRWGLFDEYPLSGERQFYRIGKEVLPVQWVHFITFPANVTFTCLYFTSGNLVLKHQITFNSRHWLTARRLCALGNVEPAGSSAYPCRRTNYLPFCKRSAHVYWSPSFITCCQSTNTMLSNSHGNCRVVVRWFPYLGRICGSSHGFCSSAEVHHKQERKANC